MSVDHRGPRLLTYLPTKAEEETLHPYGTLPGWGPDAELTKEKTESELPEETVEQVD